MARTRRHLGDPSWYRIGYAIAVQKLLAADRGVGGAAQAAERDAEQLLVCVREQLAGAGWHTVGWRPGWWRRRWLRLRWRRRLRLRPPKRSAIRDERLASFLAHTVEPATVALLWSARVAQGEPLPVLDAAAAPVRLRRDERDADLREWCGRYLTWLLSEVPPEAGWRQLLRGAGYLTDARRVPSRRQRRRRTRPSYRARYNVGCLLGRVMAQERSSGAEPEASRRELALRQLQMCFSALEGPPRDLLARWAWADPGLQGVQDEDARAFERIVGRKPEDVEAAEAVAGAPDPSWLGRWRRTLRWRPS